MSLKIRKVPKEIFSIMNLGDDFNHLWIPDPHLSLFGLGTSYLVEFFEFFGDTVGKYFTKFRQGTKYETNEDFDTFITQEQRHAAAHKQLNIFMAKNYPPPSKEKYHARVYDFMYITYKEFVEPILEGLAKDAAEGKTLDSPFFKEAFKRVAIFESEVCIAGLSFFEKVMDRGRIDAIMEVSQNLGVLYLFGYHYAEEIEHCQVSIGLYEDMYQEQLWSKEQIARYSKEDDFLSSRILTTTMYVAKMLNVDATLKQLADKQPNYRASITEGFSGKNPEIQKKREYYLNKWDNEWEPMLLAKIKERLS